MAVEELSHGFSMMKAEGENLLNKKNVSTVIKMMYKIYTYKQFLSAKAIGISLISKCLDDCVKEIDVAVRNFITQNSDRTVEIVEINFGKEDMAICPEEQDEVIKLLTRIHKQRANFLGNFPIWKNYRLESVKCLLEIADELQVCEDNGKHLDLVASLSGFSAGLINVAKMVKEFVPVPEYLKKAAPVLSAVNGLLRSYNSATRQRNLERLTKESQQVIEDDSRQFEAMMRWFDYNAKLVDSVKYAIGTELYELIFVKLKKFYEEIRTSNQPSKEDWKKLFEPMVDFLVKEGHRYSMAVPLAAISLKLFILFSSVILSPDWTDAALYVSRIANFGKATVYVAQAALAVKEVAVTNGIANCNVGSCVGIMLDIGLAMLDFSRLVKSDAASEQAKSIRKIAETIEGEIFRIEHVYTTLNSESLKN